VNFICSHNIYLWCWIKGIRVAAAAAVLQSHQSFLDLFDIPFNSAAINDCNPVFTATGKPGDFLGVGF
jgi:hypothetical protein